jgi:hypothetical protein
VAKKKKGGGCLAALILTIVVGGLVLISNAFNFAIVLSHGPAQYLYNLAHFHSDLYCEAKEPIKVFEDIISVADTEQNPPIVTLNEGKRFKVKGYRRKGRVTWIAVKVFDGPNVIYGYFFVPEKISTSSLLSTVSGLFEDTGPLCYKYFEEVPYGDAASHWAQLANVFMLELESNVKIMEAKGAADMQKIEESAEFGVIPYAPSDDMLYYCSKEEYGTAERIYNTYLGTNFETHYLQARSNYDPKQDGVFTEGSLMRIVGKWYFKIGIALFLLIALLIVLRRSSASREQG